MKGCVMDAMPHQPNSLIENLAMVVFLGFVMCVFPPLLNSRRDTPNPVSATEKTDETLPFPITIHESRPAPTPESPEGNADASQDATQPDGVPGRDIVRNDPVDELSEPVRSPYEVTVYTASWCVPCREMKRRDGEGNADVRLTWVESRPPAGVPEVYPALCWRDRDNLLRYVHGQIQLSVLLAIIERNNPPERKPLP